MIRLKTRLLSAFAADPSGGNIGGVVYEDELLAASERQRIAADLAVSTTAFVRDAGKGVYDVRFHSTLSEMGMCGHATLAVFAALKIDSRIDAGGYLQRTLVGDLKVEVENDGTIHMVQPNPVFSTNTVTVDFLAPMLGLSKSNIINVSSSSTSLRHLFVEVANKLTLSSLLLDDVGLRTMSKKYEIDTIGVWCASKIDQGYAEIQLRDLCHGVGDPEEAASGTTNGALACYLWRSKRLQPDVTGKITMVGLQGYDMGRPSRINTRLKIGTDGVSEVRVGGKAELRLSGTYHLTR